MFSANFEGNEIERTFSAFSKSATRVNASSMVNDRALSVLDREKRKTKNRELKLDEYERNLQENKTKLMNKANSLMQRQSRFEEKTSQEEFELNMKFLNLLESESLVDSKNQVLNSSIENVKSQVEVLEDLDIMIAKRLKNLQRCINVCKNDGTQQVFNAHEQIKNDLLKTQTESNDLFESIIMLQEKKLVVMKEAAKNGMRKQHILEKIEQLKKETANDCTQDVNGESKRFLNEIKETKKQIQHIQITNKYKNQEIAEMEKTNQQVQAKIISEAEKTNKIISETKLTKDKAKAIRERVLLYKTKNFGSILLSLFQNREETKLIQENMVIPDSSKLERELKQVEEDLLEEKQKEKKFNKMCKAIDLRLSKKDIAEKKKEKELKKELKLLVQSSLEQENQYKVIIKLQLNLVVKTKENPKLDQNIGVVSNINQKSVIERLEQQIEENETSLKEMHQIEYEMSKKLNDLTFANEKLMLSCAKDPNHQISQSRLLAYNSIVNQKINNLKMKISQKKQRISELTRHITHYKSHSGLEQISNKCYIRKVQYNNLCEKEINKLPFLLETELLNWEAEKEIHQYSGCLNNWNIFLDSFLKS